MRTVGVYIDYTDDVKSCGKGLETIERKDRVESEKERKRLGGSENDFILSLWKGDKLYSACVTTFGGNSQPEDGSLVDPWRLLVSVLCQGYL